MRHSTKTVFNGIFILLLLFLFLVTRAFFFSFHFTDSLKIYLLLSCKRMGLNLTLESKSCVLVEKAQPLENFTFQRYLLFTSRYFIPV